MYPILKEDLEKQESILQQTYEDALAFLAKRSEQKVEPGFPGAPASALPAEGLGAEKVQDFFRKHYLPWVPASSGSRYFGYVIGGVTPAALAGDWYTSLIDQNAFGQPGSLDRQIEQEALQFIRDLLGLPGSFQGAFVSGATTSAFVALTCARQWAAAQKGHSASEEGLYGLPRPDIASGLTHGANYKAASMAGFGRNIHPLPLLPGREAVDIQALKEYLASRDQSRPLIYIANIGTANSGDIDDLNAIAELKERYGFWLHADGAFGGLMACVPEWQDRFRLLSSADSLTMDTHKWLNVPYDGAIVLTRHLHEQYQSFSNELTPGTLASENTVHHHLTPEGSRRLRALPAWFTMLAYGKAGYADICRRNVAMCRLYGEMIKNSDCFRLLNEVRSNVVAFTLNLPPEKITEDLIKEILGEVQKAGITYSNYVPYLNKPALRVCMTNWMTEEADVRAAYRSMEEAARQVISRRF